MKNLILKSDDLSGLAIDPAKTLLFLSDMTGWNSLTLNLSLMD